MPLAVYPPSKEIGGTTCLLEPSKVSRARSQMSMKVVHMRITALSNITHLDTLPPELYNILPSTQLLLPCSARGRSVQTVFRRRRAHASVMQPWLASSTFFTYL